MDMATHKGQHRTPHGEYSTMEGMTGKRGASTPGYEGKHRTGDKIEGHKMGDPKRVPKTTDYERGN